MRTTAACLFDIDLPAVVERMGTERNGRREKEGRFEFDIHVKRAGQATFEGREAASLDPHAVGDRARKAEEARNQRIHVDWIDVARDGGVATADVPRDAPEGRWRTPPPTPPPSGGGGGGGGG